jgi:predicted RND superfamily exporter protein
MIILLSAVTRLVRRLPLATVIVALLVTATFAALASRVQVAAGMEGFAPDNLHIDAIDTLGERFAAAGGEVLQLVVAAEPGGELVSADGLRAVTAITHALTASEAAGHLASARTDR